MKAARAGGQSTAVLATRAPQAAPSHWELQAKQALSDPSHALLLCLNGAEVDGVGSPA